MNLPTRLALGVGISLALAFLIVGLGIPLNKFINIGCGIAGPLASHGIDAVLRTAKR
jgi:hypothetical protein